MSLSLLISQYICSTINGTDYTCSTKHIRIRKFLHLKVINNFSLPSTDESCIGYVPNGSIIYCVDGSPHQCHDNSNTLPNSLRQYFVMQGIIIISLYNHNDIIIVATTVTDIMAPEQPTANSKSIYFTICPFLLWQQNDLHVIVTSSPVSTKNPPSGNAIQFIRHLVNFITFMVFTQYTGSSMSSPQPTPNPSTSQYVPFCSDSKMTCSVTTLIVTSSPVSTKNPPSGNAIHYACIII